jgi:hypothetical protein
MGFVVSYDDKSGMPSSEIELNSGEHVLLTLDRNGLVVKLLARPGNAERELFAANAETVAHICAGLFDDQGQSQTSPLQILASAVTQMPDAGVVEAAFQSAETVVTSGTARNFTKPRYRRFPRLL